MPFDIVVAAASTRFLHDCNTRETISHDLNIFIGLPRFINMQYEINSYILILLFQSSISREYFFDQTLKKIH